jgi:hypothetical protein
VIRCYYCERQASVTCDRLIALRYSGESIRPERWICDRNICQEHAIDGRCKEHN